MNNSLIAYSKKQEVAKNGESFKAFISLFKDINPNLSKTDVVMVKECIEDDKITIAELEKATKQAYKDPDRYGKVEWNHIWKWVKSNREIGGKVNIDMRRFH